MALKTNPGSDPQAPREILQPFALRSGAEDREERLGTGREERYSFEQEIDPLLLEQPPGVDERRKARFRRAGCGALDRFERDADRHDRHLSTSANPNAIRGETAVRDRPPAERHGQSFDRGVGQPEERSEIVPPVGAPVLVPGDDQRLFRQAAAESEREEMNVGDVGRLDDVVRGEVEARDVDCVAERFPRAPLAGGGVQPASSGQGQHFHSWRRAFRSVREPGQGDPVAARGEGLAELQVAVLDAADRARVDAVVKEEDAERASAHGAASGSLAARGAGVAAVASGLGEALPRPRRLRRARQVKPTATWPRSPSAWWTRLNARSVAARAWGVAPTAN